MSTTVWLFEPRSHGRRKADTRARNGAPLPGRPPSSHVPHRSASPALCFVPVWARSIFSSSCVVVRWPARAISEVGWTYKKIPFGVWLKSTRRRRLRFFVTQMPVVPKSNLVVPAKRLAGRASPTRRFVSLLVVCYFTLGPSGPWARALSRAQFLVLAVGGLDYA